MARHVVNIASYVEKLYGNLNSNVQEEVNKAGLDCIKYSKKFITTYTKNHTKKTTYNHPHYVDLYTYKTNKTNSSYEFTLYNRKYQLSHLLEDGHRVVNQYGDTGKRTTAFGIYDKATVEARKDFTVRVNKAIKNACNKTKV